MPEDSTAKVEGQNHSAEVMVTVANDGGLTGRVRVQGLANCGHIVGAGHDVVVARSLEDPEQLVFFCSPDCHQGWLDRFNQLERERRALEEAEEARRLAEEPQPSGEPAPQGEDAVAAALIGMSMAAQEHLVGLEGIDAVWVLQRIQDKMILAAKGL